MARILVLVPFPMSAENRAQRAAQLGAVEMGPGFDFEFRSVRVAPSNYVSHHDYVIAEISMIEAGMNAEKEGFDAVCIDTVSDSGLGALRSMLDIPVIGPGRTAMLVAQMLGEKFSILVMWDAWKPLYKKTLDELGMHHKCASVRSIGIMPDNRNLLTGKQDEVFPLLAEAGRKAIAEDGAEVLMLGSTTMHEAHAYLAAHLPVPVINPGPLSYKMAEAMLALGHRQSRRAYPKPLEPKQALFAAAIEAGARADRG